MNPDAEVVPVTPDMAVTVTLGGYDLLRRLGAGGMAEVHLARHNAIEGFQKLVVLKQILPHLSRDRHFVRMFLSEARVAALLDHPNIVQVYDLGTEGEDYYFTMEFVYGENLTGLLKALRKAGMRLSLEHVITLARGVACGLHYAHERVGFDGRPLGIVHRDVSPTNVMITYEGGVKIADFGIAKVITRTDVTRAGIRKGKVPYMSPEQCRAEPIDRRSDIFSLGIVMYEMLTGVRLFDGDNEFGVMNTIVNGTIAPPSTKRPDVPKDLDRIIMRALTRDKSKRYQTAREMQLELEALARDHKLRATESALGELLYHLFRPQPFPWGALMGDGVSNAVHLHTIAETSQPSGLRIGSRTDITSGSNGPVTGGSVNAARGTVVTSADQRRGTLRGVAIGLGAVATAAATLVLGLWLGSRGAKEEAAEAEAEAAAAAAATDAPSADTPASDPTPDAAATPPPDEPTSPVIPPPAPPPSEAVVPPSDAPPPVDVPPPEPAIEPEPEPEPDPIPAPSPRPSSTRKKKAAPKKKKKKPNPDAFMPGM